jgi:transcription termination factor NusB
VRTTRTSRRLQGDEALIDFARSLVSGVRTYRAEIDALLTTTADHWSIVRMAATDRNPLVAVGITGDDR